ncbi:MAG: hypothetical protein RLZZ196_2729 [Bacteroidota bacterium]|jgi:hypothetical protein
MKYSQYIGILACLVVLFCSFLPWSIVVSEQITISGFDTKGTSFGRPGLFLNFFTVIALIFFVTPFIWAKRTNIFIGAIVFAWSVRNYILVSTCLMGECPVKQPALYALVAASFVVMMMTLLPKINTTKK